MLSKKQLITTKKTGRMSRCHDRRLCISTSCRTTRKINYRKITVLFIITQYFPGTKAPRHPTTRRNPPLCRGGYFTGDAYRYWRQRFSHHTINNSSLRTNLPACGVCKTAAPSGQPTPCNYWCYLKISLPPDSFCASATLHLPARFP